MTKYLTVKERVDGLFKDLCESAYEGPEREEVTKAIEDSIEDASDFLKKEFRKHHESMERDSKRMVTFIIMLLKLQGGSVTLDKREIDKLPDMQSLESTESPQTNYIILRTTP